MSRKLRAPQFKVLDAVDATTNPLSTETSIKQLDTVLYEIAIDAGVIATLSVEVSNDPEAVPQADRTFRALDFGQTLTLDGSLDTEYQVLLRDCAFNFIRLAVLDNSSTGNISAWIQGVSKGA